MRDYKLKQDKYVTIYIDDKFDDKIKSVAYVIDKAWDRFCNKVGEYEFGWNIHIQKGYNEPMVLLHELSHVICS